MHNIFSFFFVYGALFFVFSPQIRAMHKYSPPLVVSTVAFMTDNRLENYYDEPRNKDTNIRKKFFVDNKIINRHKNENKRLKNPSPKGVRAPYIASTKGKTIIFNTINAPEKTLIEMNFEEQKNVAFKTLKQKAILGAYK